MQCVLFVLMNRKKHEPGTTVLDPCSSARWFQGWREFVPTPEDYPAVASPLTWLAAIGWRRYGLISITERPRS